MMTPALVYLCATAVGLVVGSFVATAAIRFCRGEAFLGGRSHCDGCGAPLGFAATVPLISYLLHRGTAPCCTGRIDPLHPSGELLGLAVMLTAAATGELIRGVLVAGLGLCLVALSLIDVRTQRLPDFLVGLAAAIGLTMAALGGVARLLEGLAAACVTFCVLEFMRRSFLHIYGRGGLGGGDVKLFAGLALWLGILTPAALGLASLIGLLQIAVLRPRDGRIAFGPAIALSGFVLGVSRGLSA